MKRHILTLLAVLIYTFSHAQTYSITGTLRDATSGDVGLNPYYQSNFSYTWGRGQFRRRPACETVRGSCIGCLPGEKCCYGTFF